MEVSWDQGVGLRRRRLLACRLIAIGAELACRTVFPVPELNLAEKFAAVKPL